MSISRKRAQKRGDSARALRRGPRGDQERREEAKRGEEDHLETKRDWIQSLSQNLTIKLGFGESGS